jgi:ATP-dependent Zn protease
VVGPLRMLGIDADAFLPGEAELSPLLSGAAVEALNREVRRLADAARQRATDLLVYHQGDLEALAARLVEMETVEGPELEGSLVAVGPEAALLPRSGRKRGSAAAAD